MRASAAQVAAGLVLLRATVLFPAPFAAMRERFCEGGDKAFIRSLWSSQQWDTGGGGRRGTFHKTTDGRYVLKQVNRSEFDTFQKHGREYFAYLSQTHTTLPSLLVKVMGAFAVEFIDRSTKRRQEQFLLVQENLFHGHNVSRVFDLKGANRDSSPIGEDDSETVLDENFFHFNSGHPLLLSEVDKQQLTRALHNDTLFLQTINVIDYSLLVGVVQQPQDASAAGASQQERRTLVVGVIDYCRQFHLLEKLEFHVRHRTVMPPRQYRGRFRDAMHRYFVASMESQRGGK